MRKTIAHLLKSSNSSRLRNYKMPLVNNIYIITNTTISSNMRKTIAHLLKSSINPVLEIIKFPLRLIILRKILVRENRLMVI